MNKLLKAVPILILFGCKDLTNSKEKFSNNGVTTVLNGKNEIDSLKFSCDSCFEILQDKAVFDTLVIIATNEAKNVLRNKLSFRPVSVDFQVIRQDSVYYTSGKRIDSLVAVIAKYKCIGKNAYGVEDEVESTTLTYLINNRVTNLDGKIKKRPLALVEKGTVSRSLSLYDNDGASMTIQPVKLNDAIHLIVTTDKSCVENSRLIITFVDDTEISSKSWNDFNCKGTSYFKLSSSNLDKLKSAPLKYISFSEDELVFCSVPENESDYFIQYVNLVKRN